MKRGHIREIDWHDLGTSADEYGVGSITLWDNQGKPRQGNRTDVDEMIDEADTGTSYNDLGNLFPKLVRRDSNSCLE